MNAKQAEAMLRHGLALQRLFGLRVGLGQGPITLIAQLHRIEARAHRYAERECSDETFDTSEEASQKRGKAILDAVDRILEFRALAIPVILNGDPRGYSLKIDAEWMRSHPEDVEGLHQDWGGYGILAPEF